MHNSNTFKWVDKLNDITNSYNNTIHRSIRMTPASVTSKDEIKIWKLLYENNDDKYFLKPPTTFKFLINDVVRISSIKKLLNENMIFDGVQNYSLSLTDTSKKALVNIL